MKKETQVSGPSKDSVNSSSESLPPNQVDQAALWDDEHSFLSNMSLGDESLYRARPKHTQIKKPKSHQSKKFASFSTKSMLRRKRLFRLTKAFTEMMGKNEFDIQRELVLEVFAFLYLEQGYGR